MFRHKELVGATGPARAVLRAAQRWGVLSVVLALAVGGSVSAQNCVTAPPGMVAWWPLDEVLGTVVHDIVGGLDGTAMPGTIGALAGTGPVTSAAWGPPTFPVGVVGNSLFFFLDRRVEVQSSVALNPGTGDFAIDAWVIFAASSNGQELTIVRKGTTSGQTYRFVIDDVSSPQLSFKLEGSNGVSSLGAPILPGMWHHVAVTLERAGGGQTVTLYIDGAAANAASGADVGMIVNTEPLLIGGDGVLAGEIALDEVEIFDRALDPQEVQEIFSAGSAGKCRCVTAPCCMAAWWSLDELWGPTAHDLLGPHLSDGTYFGAPTPIPAVVQDGLAFDGVDDCVQVPDDPELDVGTGDFSIDAWIFVQTSNAVHTIVDKRTLVAGTVTGYLLFVDTYNHLCLQLADGTHTNYWSDVIVTPGQWHHIAVTVERAMPTGIQWYLDGSPVSSPDDPTLHLGSLDNMGPLLLGKNADPACAYWLCGALDELEIFKRVLAPCEIAAIFAAGSAGKCK